MVESHKFDLAQVFEVSVLINPTSALLRGQEDQGSLIDKRPHSCADLLTTVLFHCRYVLSLSLLMVHNAQSPFNRTLRGDHELSLASIPALPLDCGCNVTATLNLDASQTPASVTSAL